MIIKLLAEHHLEFLSLTGGCRGLSESTLVRMPHCWKSHITAHYSILRDENPDNTQYLTTNGPPASAGGPMVTRFNMFTGKLVDHSVTHSEACIYYGSFQINLKGTHIFVVPVSYIGRYEEAGQSYAFVSVKVFIHGD